MAIRGVRGAVRVAANTREEIFSRTQELLRRMVEANGLRPDDIAAAFFTMTPDLDADFPAHAAREIGWTTVPMICASEVAVRGAMDRLVRVMLLVNTARTAAAVRHQYLGEAACLRPDLAKTAPPAGRRRRSSRSSSNTTRSDGGRR